MQMGRDVKIGEWRVRNDAQVSSLSNGMVRGEGW